MERRYVCVDHIADMVRYKITMNTMSRERYSDDFKAGMYAVLAMMSDPTDQNYMMIEYPYDKAAENAAFEDACMNDIAGLKR